MIRNAFGGHRFDWRTKRAISLPKSVLEEFFPPHMSLRSSALGPMRYNSAQNMENPSWEAVQVFSW